MVQQTSAPSITPFFHNPVDIQFSNSGQSITYRITPQFNNQIFKVYVPFAVESISIDPQNYIVNKVGTLSYVSNIQQFCLITLYPNPTNDRLYIQSNRKIDHAYIYDVVGNIIHVNINSECSCIDVSTLPQGVYFLKLNNETHKFIKI